MAEIKVNLIPMPQEHDFNQQYFKYKTLRISSKSKSLAKKFSQDLKMKNSSKGGTVLLTKAEVKNPLGFKGAYSLNITSSKIEVRANDSAGFFYAAQTLRQLSGKKGIQCGTVEDWASYKVRGFMHDIGRNFIPVSILKEQVKMMALYKMNTLHLHLTDYPGYRLESKKYPILNSKEIGEKNRQPGEFYTAAEMKDFVRFCAAHHVTIIPEIDMPGHSDYFKRAFKTDMQTDKGVAILRDLIKEVAEIFPKKYCPYLHIGSDEVKIYRKNFMQDMVKEIRSHGFEVIYWRPGGNVTDEKVITQLWTGSAKPHGNNLYIDSRATYINHMDPFAGVVRMFFMQPCRNDGTEVTNGLGGILAAWADNTIHKDKGYYGIYDITPIYPVMVTWSENLWRGRRNTDMAHFISKLPAQGTDFFKEFKNFERRLLYHRNRFFKGKHFPYVKQTNIPWKLITVNDAAIASKLEKQIAVKDKKSYKIDGQTIEWRTDKKLQGATVHLQHFFSFEAYLDKEKKSNAFVQTYVYSPKNQISQWWIQFGTPSSSGRRNSANPPAGQWNHYGANTWLNGKRVEAPVWNNPGGLGSQKASYKVPFTNEAYFYRKPTELKLKKGWNRIVLKVPASSHRKSKWMFTCVPVKVDGLKVREASKLKFSADKK